MSVIATTSSSVALEQANARQVWLLPDNSLVLVVNLGTINVSTTGTNHTVVLQSTNWQTGSPTWTFVKQITSTGNMLAASHWDGTRFHVAYAGANANATTGLFYLSASYSSGIWTWDSSATTLLSSGNATNNASSPAMTVDKNGIIYVAYRNQTVTSPTNSVCLFTKSAGGWNASPVQASGTTGTASAYYGAFAYDGTAVTLLMLEGTTYTAQVHTDGGTWGSLVTGPTSASSPGQQYGPLSAIPDGNGTVYLGASTTGGMKVFTLSYSGNQVTWGQSSQILESVTNVTAPEWLFCGGVLYGFYSKLTATNTSDVWSVQYDTGANSWNTATNLTNASASNNVNPCTARNFVQSSSVTVLPVIYESGTASPFSLNLITQIPVALNRTKDYRARVSLLSHQTFKSYQTRLFLGPSHDYSARINLQPATVSSSSLPNGAFGVTYGLRNQTDVLDIRVPILARALNMTWFRLQKSIGDIWLNQTDLTSGTITNNTLNWSALDQSIGMLNQFGLHVTFPLRAVNGTPAWFFSNPAQLRSTSSDGSGNDYAPDPVNMALFASAVAYRYDGIHGPIGPNGMPLKVDAIEVGNEEFNITNSKKIPTSGAPTAQTIYGTYNSPLATYNALSGVGTGGLPPQPRRDPHFFMNVLKAVQPAIKAYYPSVLVGMCAHWWMNPANHKDFLTGCYLEGMKGLVNFANIHYYSNQLDPTIGSATTSSITTAITNMASSIAVAGDTIPIWVTEFGWGTTDQGHGLDCDENMDAARYQAVLQACFSSKAVAKVFAYTFAYRYTAGQSETSSLIQYNPVTNSYRFLPAFYALQNFITQNTGQQGAPVALFPATNRRLGILPTRSRRTGAFPAPKRRQS